jgi:hypothetical protein
LNNAKEIYTLLTGVSLRRGWKSLAMMLFMFQKNCFQLCDFSKRLAAVANSILLVSQKNLGLKSVIAFLLKPKKKKTKKKQSCKS